MGSHPLAKGGIIPCLHVDVNHAADGGRYFFGEYFIYILVIIIDLLFVCCLFILYSLGDVCFLTPGFFLDRGVLRKKYLSEVFFFWTRKGPSAR